ncbi:MAG: LysM peptidoglycan-binding domain-containing protein [Bacteroidales bacterium]|nr:LysM peptidoglycan-binding domain-containing protein [Bacteroidales bacterium]
MRRQIDSLLRLTDSLYNQLAISNSELYMMEAADSLINASDINPGSFDLTDDEELVVKQPADMDSLLAAWYEQKNLSLENKTGLDLDTAHLTSNIPDSVFVERLYRMNSFIAVPYNNVVRNMLIYYTERIPNTAEVVLGLAPHYMPQFEEIFDAYEMPIELAAMAIIESALNTKAVSRARAKGMWQFMYSTALRYNLTINSFVDERFDPIKAADAAARYLKDSYEIFGDWMLAIASYNCGAGNVSKAIRRSGGSKDVWTIYPYLPRETRGYIPSFIAALYLLEYYQEHNITPKSIPMPPHMDTLHINKMLHFDQVTQFTGMSKEELRNFNPQYLHDIIPGAEKEYILRIPYNYTAAFVEHENEIYTYKDSVYFNPAAIKLIKETGSTSATRVVHTVKKNETLSHIALKYGVRVSDLQRWNNVRANNIRVGQKLVIYRNGGPTSSSSDSSSGNVKTTVADGYVIYTVKKGDNLWDIAKKFPGVSANNIMKLNNMTSQSKIYPGMKLKIKKA